MSPDLVTARDSARWGTLANLLTFGRVVCVPLLAVAVVSGIGALATAIALTVAAAIVGFLIFNFPVDWNRPIRSFMGDAGSTLLGFTIVWVTLVVSQGADRAVSPVICLWFASIPIYDCLTCFVCRSLSGNSPFTPGRDHFHHTLGRGGFGNRQVLVILAGMQLIYAGLGLTGFFLHAPDYVMFAGWSVMGLLQLVIIKNIAARHRFFQRKKRGKQAA